MKCSCNEIHLIAFVGRHAIWKGAERSRLSLHYLLMDTSYHTPPNRVSHALHVTISELYPISSKDKLDKNRCVETLLAIHLQVLMDT